MDTSSYETLLYDTFLPNRVPGTTAMNALMWQSSIFFSTKREYTYMDITLDIAVD